MMMETNKYNLENQSNKPRLYWLVEFTLTSGETLQFYVSARTQFDAYEKADGYKCYLEDPKLRKKLEVFQFLS